MVVLYRQDERKGRVFTTKGVIRCSACGGNGFTERCFICNGSRVDVAGEPCHACNEKGFGPDSACKPCDATGFEQRLTICAENAKRSGSSVRAKLSVFLNRTSLFWHEGNVNDDEMRTRLSNSAYRAIEGLKQSVFIESYPKTDFKRDLDAFCAGLWDFLVRNAAPAAMPGTLERHGTSYILDPFIVEGGGTIMFAPPGGGKSWTGMLKAVSIDAGVDLLWKVQQRRVVWVNLERDMGRVQQRLGDVNAVLGLPRDRALTILHARGHTLAEVIDSVRYRMEEGHFDVAFLDSLSRAGYGDMIKSQVANEAMDAMNGLAKTWFVIAHTPRPQKDSDNQHTYGSQMYDAAADVLVAMTSQPGGIGQPLGIGLKITKSNDVPRSKWALRTYAYQFDDLGLIGARPADRGEFPALDADNPVTPLQDIANFLLSSPGARSTQTIISNETHIPISTVGRLLRSSPEFVRVGQCGKEVWYGLASKTVER